MMGKESEIEQLLKDIQELHNQPEFLTQAHKDNYEKGMKQVAKWQEFPPTLEQAMKQQKEREK